MTDQRLIRFTWWTASAFILIGALWSANSQAGDSDCNQSAAAVYQAIAEPGINIADRDHDTRDLALWLHRQTDGSKRLFIRWYAVFCRHGQARSGFRVIAGVLMIPGDMRGSI